MAGDAQYNSGADSTTVKRKYEDSNTSPLPPSSGRRTTGFSDGNPLDSAPSYNNVPPPMDAIQLAKQKAQEIAARIFNNAEVKRPKFDNGGTGWDSNDSRDFSSGPTDLGHPAPSVPSSYGYGNPSKKIEIPNGRVGVIIGKAGETIKHLQLQSGAKIQITRDMDVDPHSLTREVELTGSAESIEKAEQLIRDVLAEAESGGPGTVARRVSGQGTVQFAMQVPNKKVGLVIGKGGETIKTMQASTGARIQVIPLHLPPGDTSTHRTVQIDGSSDQIEAAKQLVNEVISENRPHNPTGSGGYPQQGYQAQTPSAQMQQPGYYGYTQPGSYPGQPAPYTQPPYGSYPQQTSGGWAGSWDQPTGQQTAQGGGGGGYDYYGHQQSQQTQPPGAPATTDASAYGYGQQGQGYGQQGQGSGGYASGYNAAGQTTDNYGQQGQHGQHGYDNPTSGYNAAGQTQTTDGQNASQAPPTSVAQSGYGQQPGPNPSYPQGSSQPVYGAAPTSQPVYGTQPGGYGGYGPPTTQNPGTGPQTGYGQPQYGAPPTYGGAGYAQPPYGAPPSYGAQQPPAYGGSYGGGYQPPAYSSDATAAPAASQAAQPVPKGSPQQN